MRASRKPDEASGATRFVANSESWGSMSNRHDLSANASTLYGQPSDTDRKLESPWSRAAGIEIEDTATRLLLRNMTVPGYHNFEASRFGLQIELRQVVQNIDKNAREFDQFSLGQSARPRRIVDVPADGCDRCNCREFVEDFGRAYVSSVNDVLGSTERVDRLRTKQAMRIRNDADDDGVLSSRFLVFGWRSSACSFPRETERLPSPYTCRKSSPLRQVCAGIPARPASAPNPG